MQNDIVDPKNYKQEEGVSDSYCGDPSVSVAQTIASLPPMPSSRWITHPELFTSTLMRRFGPGIAMVGYTESASLSDLSSFVCGSGFILEGRFLITAAVVHDTLSWHEPNELFAAVIDERYESTSENNKATSQLELQSQSKPKNTSKLRHIPITFIDCDYERGIAVYRLSTKMPVRISFADIDFSENELVTGVNAITLSYCAANESFRCNRIPILMSGQAYVRAGGCAGSDTMMPLMQNDRLYSIINAALAEQEYGAPLLCPGKSDTAPPRIVGIVGGSLDCMYRDFILIEDNPQLRIAWPFAGFITSSIFNRMNEEITSNPPIINDAAPVAYQAGQPNSVGTSASGASALRDLDAFEEDLDAFMDEFDSEDEDNVLGRGIEDDF